MLKTYRIEKEHKTMSNTPHESTIKISPFSIKFRTNSDKNSNNSLLPLFKIPSENKRFFWSSADRNSRTPWTGLTRAWLTIIEIWRASWPRTRVTDASPLCPGVANFAGKLAEGRKEANSTRSAERDPLALRRAMNTESRRGLCCRGNSPCRSVPLTLVVHKCESSWSANTRY